MPPPATFFREAGTGPGVVCLHSNASSSNQWRALMELLAPRFHVLAPDSYGAGRGPAWPTDREIGLIDEARLLEPVFAQAGATIALVGHSYGAAVSLIAALAQPQRIRALAVYEPTLFCLLDSQQHSHDADGIQQAVQAASQRLDQNDPDGAARCFIDYWMGAGAWAQTPEPRRGPIRQSIVNVLGWAKALMTEPATLHAFSELTMPILLMTGSDSPTSSRSVAKLLTDVLPQLEVVEFKGLGHMGPVTDPEIVNPVIERFLRQSL